MADDTTRETDPCDLHVRQIHLRAVREAAREVDFVASTDTIDSYGDSVVQNWNLKRYKRNPVVLWSHSSCDVPIGQAVRVEVVNGQLETTVRFASEKASPKAEQVWQGILEKTIRAVSVGFRPREIRYERRDDVEVCVLDDNELWEISVVAIPANPDALAKQKAAALEAFRAAKPPPEEKLPPALERGGDEPTGREAMKESHMDEKQKAALEQRIAEHEKSIRDIETKHAEEKVRAEKAEAEVKALSAQTERLVQERDAQAKRADELDAKLVEIEVGALVGKKITAAEKSDFVELRRTNKDLFERIVGQRTDVSYLGTVVIAEEKSAATPPPAAVSDDADAAAFAAFQKSLEKPTA